MIIVDRDIHRLLQDRILTITSIIEGLPFNPSTQIGPGSIDLRVSNSIRKYKKDVNTIDLVDDPKSIDNTEPIEILSNGEIVIHPKEIILTTTLEIVVLPPNMAGILSARSSIARLGLLVHITQNYIQPGHSQLIPLQLANLGDRPIKIKPFLPVCQLTLFSTSSNAEAPYGSKKDAKYKDELSKPQASKIGLELGIYKSNQIDSDEVSLRHQDLQKEVALLREEVNTRSALEVSLRHQDLQKEVVLLREEVNAKNVITSQGKRLSNILSLIYIILGVSFSLIIGQIDSKPFPSLTLLIGAVCFLFCLAVIVIANWRQ